MDGGEKVAPGLVVAGGDGTKLLEPAEEVLDQVAGLEQVTIVGTGLRLAGAGRDDGGLAGRGERHEDALVRVKSLVGDQRVGLHAWQQVVGTGKIMDPATGQIEADRIAECVDQGVDFRAQSTSRAADRLVLAGFFCAPELC